MEYEVRGIERDCRHLTPEELRRMREIVKAAVAQNGPPAKKR